MENKDMKMFSGLMLGLFLILVIVAVIFIGAGYMKEIACEQGDDENFVWELGTCYDYQDTDDNVSTAEVAVEVTTLDSLAGIAKVEVGIDIALGLLGLIILITIFKVVIRTAKSFGDGAM